MSEQTWADLEAVIGQDFSDGTESWGVETVEATGIRRLCEVVELGCPIHWDETAARQNGYDGLALPVSAISSTYSFQSIWKPGDGTRWKDKDVHGLFGPPMKPGSSRPMPGPPTQFAFATDIEIECRRPVSVGDRLYRKGNRLLSVTPRETSVGTGAFTVTETSLYNQRNELVALMRHGGYRYNPHPESKAAASAPKPAARKEQPPVTPPRADWSESLYWDDVKEGDPVPAMTVELTIQRLVMAAGANRDFNAVHHDTYLTQKTGVPEIYANNGLLQSFWERAVREYIGTLGSIRKLGPFRMRAFNFAGDTLTTAGKVLRKYEEGREKLLELDLVTENDRGPSVGPGRVTVALPSRS